MAEGLTEDQCFSSPARALAKEWAVRRSPAGATYLQADGDTASDLRPRELYLLILSGLAVSGRFLCPNAEHPPSPQESEFGRKHY